MKRLLKNLKDWYYEGWYFGDEESKSRSMHVHHNWLVNVIANLTGGSFLTGLLLFIGADDSFLGLVSMFTFGTNILQIFSSLILERFPKRKKLCVVVKAINHLINVAFIGVIPLFPIDRQFQLILMGGCILIVNLLNAFLNPALSIWFLQFIPQKIRSQYFGLLSMINGVSVAIATMIGSALVDTFKVQGREFLGLTILRIAAIILAVADITSLTKMKEEEYPKSSETFGIKDILIRPFKETKYLRMVFISFFWNFAANMPGSFFTAYMLQDLNVSYTFLTLVNLVNIPILIFVTPLWRRYISKRHWFSVINMGVLGYVIHFFMHSFVTADTLVLYPISIVLAYSMLSGINIFCSNLPYINIPEHNQTLFIGFFSAMTNLGALLGVTLSTQFVIYTQNFTFSIFRLSFTSRQFLMLIASGAMLCTYVVIRWLQGKNTPTIE